MTQQNVTVHIKNIYKDKELSQKSTCKESLQVQKEGERKIKEYNLDIIIAVGYRINSVLGTKFRKWATKILQEVNNISNKQNQYKIESCPTSS